MVKLRKSPKNIELTINLAKKMGSFSFFLRQMANSAVWRENPCAAGAGYHVSV